MSDDSENCALFADELTPEDQQFLAGLQCGSEPWSQAATEWITSSKHVELLTLKVHRQNIAAQKVYKRYGFELLDGFEDNEHLMMYHKLDLQE